MRLVREHGAEHPFEWAAIESIAGKLGCTAETRNVYDRFPEVVAPLSALLESYQERGRSTPL